MWRPRAETRCYTGPAGWSLARRARELGTVLKVEVVDVAQQPRRLATRERVVVRARGAPRDLTRYWARLDQIADAVNASHDTGGWWLRQALSVVLSIWRS